MENFVENVENNVENVENRFWTLCGQKNTVPENTGAALWEKTNYASGHVGLALQRVRL